MHHAVDCKAVQDGFPRGGADAPGEIVVCAEFGDGGVDGVFAVFDEQAVVTVGDDFAEAADVAGDDGESGGHGEEGAGAEAFAVAEIDDDGGAGESFFQVGRGFAFFEAEEGGAAGDFEDGDAVVDDADFFGDTPPETSTVLTNSETAM